MRKLTKKRLNEDVLNLIGGREPQRNGTPRLLDFLNRNRTAPMAPVVERPQVEPEVTPIVEPKAKRYPFMRR